MDLLIALLVTAHTCIASGGRPDSSDMLPGFSIDNVGNCRSAEAVSLRQQRLPRDATTVLAPDLADHFIGHLSEVVRFSSGEPFGMRDRPAPPLLDHIGHVVSARTEEKVAKSGQDTIANDVDADLIVSDAGPIVAHVKDVLATWDRCATCGLPREAVGAQHEPGRLGDVEDPVSRIGNASGPPPAVARRVDLRPESLFNGQVWARIVAILGPLGERNEGAAAADTWVGMMGLHREPPARGVTPRVVSATPGFCCIEYTIFSDLLGETSPSRGAPVSCHSVGGLPDNLCTPGTIDHHVTQANIATTICVPGYSKTVRPPVSVTSLIKRERMRAYAMVGVPASAVELDHAIPLELAGAPRDVSNLWPEAWDGPLGAHAKDAVENFAHHAVCTGTMSLAEAQTRIAADWISLSHDLLGTP